MPLSGQDCSAEPLDRAFDDVGDVDGDVAARADNLAHGFGALLCRVRTARSGAVLLE